MQRLVTGLTLLAVALIAVACGGGSRSGTSTTSSGRPSTSTATTTTGSSPASGATAPASGPTAPASITSGPIHATLHAQDHHPVAKRNWTYTVTASDRSGHPLSGTVFSRFLVAGQVVGHETPPTHHLKNGHLHDVIVFPPQSVGVPVTFETVIHTRLGTVTLGWAVKAVR